MSKSWIAAAVLTAILVGCNQQNTRPQSRTESGGEPVSAAAPVGAAQPKTAVLWVNGLSCPLCVQTIKRELWKVPGVGQIDVDYDHEMATVELTSRKGPSRGQLEQAVQRTGYTLAKLEMR